MDLDETAGEESPVIPSTFEMDLEDVGRDPPDLVGRADPEGGSLAGSSLCCLGETHCIRRACAAFVFSPAVDGFIILVIVLSSVCLALASGQGIRTIREQGIRTIRD